MTGPLLPAAGGSAVVAVGAAVTATLLLLRPRQAWPRPEGGGRLPGSRAPRWLVGGLALSATVAVPRVGALALVLAAAGAGAVALGHRRARRRRWVRTGTHVLETCEVLAGELVAGCPPGLALERAAACWAPLEPAAAAFRVGADVPDALRDLAAGIDGAADLRVVAAAWQVAHHTGQGLGAAVERVGETLRGAAATRRVVEAELASARATARLVTGLPVLALVLGSGAGGDPWGFLLGAPAGIACLAGGLAFGLAGLWWIEAIAAEVESAS